MDNRFIARELLYSQAKQPVPFTGFREEKSMAAPSRVFPFLRAETASHRRGGGAKNPAVI